MDVQQFERLLMRYERLAGCAARLKALEKRHQETLSTLISAQEGNRRRGRDMQAAEAKIEEWKEYALQLRSVIEELDPDPPRRRRKSTPMPAIPKPLEFEIPF